MADTLHNVISCFENYLPDFHMVQEPPVYIVLLQKDMCSMGPRWHSQDLLSVVSEWGLWIKTRLLSPIYPKHACLLLQFLLQSIVARMDLCWAISHSSCVITIIVMRTQKQRLNALCLLKNIFVPLHCCDLWSTMWLDLLVATKMKTSWCLITRGSSKARVTPCCLK